MSAKCHKRGHPTRLSICSSLMLEWNQPDARELASLGSLTCGLWCHLSSGCTSARRKREAVGRFACPKFLTKHENSPKYFIQASGTSALNLCYSIKAQLREIIMINFTFGVPVKTRLPLRAWMLAAIATLFSLASSLLHSPTPADNPLYAGMIWRLVWPS
jgi:hypothetical protein